MLCPEVSNFPPPKVMQSCKEFDSLDKLVETFKTNSFYSSLIIAIPDELQTPSSIEECAFEDSDYYKISECSLAEFVEPMFIEKFVKNGKMHCLSADRNCITDNCFAITTDGILTVHVLTHIFQTIGLEGTKLPHNFYEIKIDLKNITRHDKLKQSLNRLEKFDFWISWEPNEDKICPSTIAKYFYEKDFHVSVETMKMKKLNPYVTEIPSIKDVNLEEMTEWIGMLALEGDLTPTENYISTYSQPESELAFKTTRISILFVKGFITPTVVSKVCENLHRYVKSRELENYWVSVSVQSNSNSLWQWNTNSPKIFQAHDNSCSVFFSDDCIKMFSIGQLKYS
ncbi:ribonuclease P 40kDa (Rpp40) subunit domain-containing protein [Phthorimaea operculella]|nr:ribonuclease P 40kDa (Rpp40) subunit domain-containing protein [Phthorimaea operculella]